MALPAIKLMRLAEALPLEPTSSVCSARTSTRAGSMFSAAAAICWKSVWAPWPTSAPTQATTARSICWSPYSSTQASQCSGAPRLKPMFLKQTAMPSPAAVCPCEASSEVRAVRCGGSRRCRHPAPAGRARATVRQVSAPRWNGASRHPRPCASPPARPRRSASRPQSRRRGGASGWADCRRRARGCACAARPGPC